MKLQNKWFIGAMLGAAVCLVSTSCVDEIKFGNSFLDKAPGGNATIDTVFNSAEYTRQFLNTCYSRQYYGLPYNTDSNGNIPDSSSPYLGKKDALTDCWSLYFSDATVYQQYYLGSLNANYGTRGNIFPYTREMVWEVVHWCWLLMENIDRVPGMDSTEKTQLVAEAKCLIAARYFDMFRHYGGLPLLYASFTGTESGYEIPRATVEETVNYMIKMLDDAINSGGLVWAYADADLASKAGHWTKAGAMALKCKIWQFAASPLFNDVNGYAGGNSEAEQQHLVWYGGYHAELWDNCLKACEAFFKELESQGGYSLNKASEETPEQYRQAYRMGYIRQNSKEVLHSVRTNMSDAFNSSSYMWHSWAVPSLCRTEYPPTQEYVEMFPWADGTPFDWKKTETEGKLDAMFLTGTFKNGEQLLSEIVLTRDPRLYEHCMVNGLPKMLDWSAGTMSGLPYELWVGGYDEGQNAALESGNYATGYKNMKYYLGTEYQRQYTHWVYLRLSDIYLTYAEALLQAKNDHRGAIDQMNIVRARVGLKKDLAECVTDKNLLSDKAALLEELLCERVRELGLEDSRYFDLVRYKRADRFEKRLHGLLAYRLDDTGNRITGNAKWNEGDKNKGALQPTRFEYERFELSKPVRRWWTYGFDPKWYLSPFPQTEINKGYGLIQNPGW